MDLGALPSFVAAYGGGSFGAAYGGGGAADLPPAPHLPAFDRPRFERVVLRCPGGADGIPCGAFTWLRATLTPRFTCVGAERHRTAWALVENPDQTETQRKTLHHQTAGLGVVSGCEHIGVHRMQVEEGAFSNNGNSVSRLVGLPALFPWPSSLVLLDERLTAPLFDPCSCLFVLWLVCTPFLTSRLLQEGQRHCKPTQG